MRFPLVLVLVAGCGDQLSSPANGDDAQPGGANTSLVAGPSVALDEDVVGYEVDDQRAASAAATGSSFFVAWEVQVLGQGVIRSAHYGANGAMVEAKPLELGHGSDPRVACTSTGPCGVVWNQSGTILFQRVGIDGALIDATPLTVASSDSGEVATVGGHDAGFMVSYHQAGQSALQRFGLSGPSLDPAPPLTNEGGIGPCDATGCWRRTSDMAFRHVNADGTSSTLTVPAEVSGQPMYACTTTACVFGRTTVAGFVARRVSTAGVLLDSSDVVVFSSVTTNTSFSAAIDSTSFVFAAADGTLEIRRMLFDGTLPAAQPATVGSYLHAGNVACAGNRCLSVALDNELLDSHVIGYRSEGDTVLDAQQLPLSVEANSQRTPLIGTGDRGSVVVWNDNRIDGGGARVAHVVDAFAPSTPTNVVPRRIAWTGSVYLATTVDGYEVLDENGQLRSTIPLSGVPSALACGPQLCAIAYEGDLHDEQVQTIDLLGTPLHVVSVTSGQGARPLAVTHVDDHFVLIGVDQDSLDAFPLNDDGTLGSSVSIGPAPAQYDVIASEDGPVLVLADNDGFTLTPLDESFTPGTAASVAGSVVGFARLSSGQLAVASMDDSGIVVRRYGPAGLSADALTIANLANRPQASISATGELAITEYDAGARAYRLRVSELQER